jgi:hypothetical protein
LRAIDWRWSSGRWYLDPGGPADPLLPTLHRPDWDLLQ